MYKHPHYTPPRQRLQGGYKRGIIKIKFECTDTCLPLRDRLPRDGGGGAQRQKGSGGPALAYLLVGVAAAGRALLAVPENAAIQEVSLTVLALVGYLLLASKTRLPTVFGAAGLVLELILCGSQTGGAWARLAPALRAADLWLFWGAALVLVRLAGRQQSKMPYIAAVPLAVYTVTHFIPSLTSVAAVSFVVFSVVMLWFAAIMIRAYNDARIKK